MIDVLFVCTGNTCRSPMAACLFNARAKERGLPYRAESAGLMASEGSPASDGAYLAMRSRGLSLNQHASRSVTAALIADARLVVCLTEQHAETLRQRFPQANVRAFQPSIPDPFGGSAAVYERAAQAIDAQIDALLNTLDR